MPSILFVCHANQFRSPIAAACFKQMLIKNRVSNVWRVESAGTWTVTGKHIPAEIVRIASEVGVDISQHITQALEPARLKTYDLILTMENGQKEALLIEFPYLLKRVRLLSEVVDGIPYDISDLQMPGRLPQDIAKELCDLISRGFSKICDLASSQPWMQV
jgi:protein-tyrosine phosphatase